MEEEIVAESHLVTQMIVSVWTQNNHSQEESFCCENTNEKLLTIVPCPEIKRHTVCPLCVAEDGHRNKGASKKEAVLSGPRKHCPNSHDCSWEPVLIAQLQDTNLADLQVSQQLLEMHFLHAHFPSCHPPLSPSDLQL